MSRVTNENFDFGGGDPDHRPHPGISHGISITAGQCRVTFCGISCLGGGLRCPSASSCLKVK